MQIEPKGFEPPPPPPPSRPGTVETHVAQQLAGEARITQKRAEFDQAMTEFLALIPTMQLKKADQLQSESTSAGVQTSQYQEMPPIPKAQQKHQPHPPTTISPRQKPDLIQSSEEALLSVNAKKFHGLEPAKPSAWGAALRLLGRAAAISTAVALIPIAYLSLTASTVIGKAINLGAGKQIVGRPLKEPPKGTQFEKMKARLLENSFRSDLDVMYHGIRAVGDPREDLAIIRATLLTTVKK